MTPAEAATRIAYAGTTTGSGTKAGTHGNAASETPPTLGMCEGGQGLPWPPAEGSANGEGPGFPKEHLNG
jgi:hypothetical protein